MSFGTFVLLDREVVAVDLRVLSGRVTYHYFAGFFGGRKSILLGVSARATILANHRRVLDFGSGCRVHPAVFGGNLAGNPVHADMLEAARLSGPCFVFNTVVDGAERVAAAFAGELEQAHLRGCAEVDRACFFPVARQADIVVASAGGWPCDINLVQSLKGLFNHRDAVRSGGVFVLVAEARGGILRGLREWLACRDRQELQAAMQARYDLAAHNSHLLLEILADVCVVLVSSLASDDVRSLGLIPAATLADALEVARRRTGGRVRVTVVHHGNATWSGLARRGVLAAGGHASAA
jgi:nickel-dependent lactate racemase